ncbi:unnamed protein product [Nezara viridula]|uniref:Uncharacterized protein n=1 Tax=Nezara viridula TaxID=85310 RepID=A0A9P0HAH6_NEZVI|nr:unnamed protein product [Nezara viridula]
MVEKLCFKGVKECYYCWMKQCMSMNVFVDRGTESNILQNFEFQNLFKCKYFCHSLFTIT